MKIEEADPAVIRRSLEASRRERIQFDVAWLRATTNLQVSADDRTLYAFMRKHFQAAYNDDRSRHGRCMVPTLETSGAVPTDQFMPTNKHSERNERIRQDYRAGLTQRELVAKYGLSQPTVSGIVSEVKRTPRVRPEHGYCRSGDGCDRLATRGRFGKRFCDHHGAELEALAVKLKNTKGWNLGGIVPSAASGT